MRLALPVTNAADPARACARLAGLVVTAAGAIVFVFGWIAGLEALKSVLPGAATLKANMALCFVAFGLALWLLARGKATAARVLTGAAAVLAGLTFLEYLFGADFGIDQWLIADNGGGAHPGRMSPASAAALLFQAAALLLLAAGRGGAGQAAALATGAIGLIGLLGHLFGVAALQAVTPFATLSIHSSFLLALLAAGTLCLRGDAGFMREVCAPGLGGRMARAMLAVIALLVPLAWLRLLGEQAGLYPTAFGLVLMVMLALATLSTVVWFLARSLNRAEAGLRLADSVIDGMNEGVTITDAEANILRVNAGFARITGYAAAEVLGQNPRLLQSGAQGRAFYAAMWDELLKSGHWHGEVINRRKSGELFPELLSITAIRDGAERTTHYVGVFADLSERLARERQMRQLADRLDLALHAGHIGTWHYDPSNGEFACDEALLALHGVAAGGHPLRLAPLLNRVHAEDRARVRTAFEDCAFDGAPLDIEYRIVPADGEIRFLAARGHAHHKAQAGSGEAAGACWDVTERRRNEEKIRALNEGLEQRVAERTAQLEAAVKELEAFSYSVAHDLRAPLRGLDGFSQVLMEDYGASLDEAGQGHLQRIRAASQRMGGLIDNLLDLSRLMRSELRPEPVDLSRMAREIVAALRDEEPQRRVDVRIEPRLSARADPTLVHVILDNLLRNAWKYSSKREDARIEFKSQPAQDGAVEFFVRDNGAGFDMRYADKLFKPFQRLHHVKDYPGSGIGLASAARAVLRHGGRIRAEGRVGEGATFYFTLAAQAFSPQPESPA